MSCDISFMIKRVCPGRWSPVLLAAVLVAGAACAESPATPASSESPPAPPSQATPESPADAAPAPPPPMVERLPVQLQGQNNVTLLNLRIKAPMSVRLEDCHGVIIDHCDLRNIQLVRCTNVRILNSYLHHAPMSAVELDDCDAVLIQNNRIERVSTGVYAHRSRRIRVRGNLCLDVQGPMPRGQMVQFDKVTGPGNEVAYNRAVNRRGHSHPEDVISVYQSQGTADSPIDIHHNVLLGDPDHGSDGKSDSGSGIMLGDSGGRFQRARSNVLLSPGQVGIGVAGGADITVEGNLVRGDRSDVSNVGIYAWNQSGAPGGGVTIARNLVHWVNARGEPNDYWDGGGFAKVTEAGNRWPHPPLLKIDPATAVDESLPARPAGEVSAD